MPLEMKTACMKCDDALEGMGEARVCSCECTFRSPYATDMKQSCSSCGGELLRRPRRRARK
jgi:hypothetical protein